MEEKYSYDDKLELGSRPALELPNQYREDTHSQTTMNQRLTLSKFILLVSKIAISSTCMIVSMIPIHNYAVFEGEETAGQVGDITDEFLRKLILCVPSALRNPSLTTFIIACLTFSLAAISYHHIHANDKHQNRFLAMGIKLGLVASIVVSLITKDPFEFKTYITNAVQVSLTASSAFHRLYAIEPLDIQSRPQTKASSHNIESGGKAEKA